MIHLRKPTDTLVGCYWLPRFIDKTRLWHVGDISFFYRVAFCSRVGLDGYFLRFFQLRKTDFLAAVHDSGDDDKRICQWFTSQRAVTPERIDEWNAFAAQVGAKGHPGYWVFHTVKWALYPKAVITPVKTAFEAIAQDEE